MSQPSQPDLFAALPGRAAEFDPPAAAGAAPVDSPSPAPSPSSAASIAAAPLPDTLLPEWAERIAQAAHGGGALRIQGGGSKAFYGQPMPDAVEVLDTRPYAGVIGYEPTELVITARAGTPLAEIEALLARHGQCLPFEPPHLHGAGAAAAAGLAPPASATVGGMVAAGLSGPARASAGGVRDHVLGVGLMNGRGQALRFGGQVIKNVAGYDVSRVIAGSLGTLGVVLDVSLKVLPIAPAHATLVFDFTQADALAHLNRWGGQPLPLSASTWLPEDAPHTGRLLLRLSGAVAAVQAACERLLREAPASSRAARWDETDAARLDAAAFWQACRDHRLPFFTHGVAQQAGADGSEDALCLWRLSVPQTAPVLPLASPTLVEWHGAQRWVWAPASAAPALRAQAQAVGGHATLFLANNSYSTRARMRFYPEVERFTPPAPVLQAVHRRLKAEFDPQRVLNPGRLYAWL